MTRTSGIFMLLAALSGCMSSNPEPYPYSADRKDLRSSEASTVSSPSLPLWGGSRLPSRYQRDDFSQSKPGSGPGSASPAALAAGSLTPAALTAGAATPAPLVPVNDNLATPQTDVVPAVMSGPGNPAPLSIGMGGPSAPGSTTSPDPSLPTRLEYTAARHVTYVAPEPAHDASAQPGRPDLRIPDALPGPGPVATPVAAQDLATSALTPSLTPGPSLMSSAAPTSASIPTTSPATDPTTSSASGLAPSPAPGLTSLPSLTPPAAPCLAPPAAPVSSPAPALTMTSASVAALPAPPLPALPTTPGAPGADSARPRTGQLAQGSNPVVPLEQKTYRVPPMVRMVNTKRITLNFEVRDVGPSGVAGVELWYTQDCKDWRKYDAPPQAHSYILEVDEEGMYGFTLVARNGLGLSQDPPTVGDWPQIWVMVDLTRPQVQLTDVTAGLDGKVPTVTIQWKASDMNLGQRPVSLSYAASEEGPWQPIATNLDSAGRFVWRVPAGAPPRMYIRAEATDMAGNSGGVQTDKPVLPGTATPQVAIINVMPGMMPGGK